MLFEEETPEKLIHYLKPDVLVKGEDWEEDKIIGAKFVKSYGGEVKRIKFKYKTSTSKIIEKILKTAKYNVKTVGNIGNPILFSSRSNKKCIFILEASSYQLQYSR